MEKSTRAFVLFVLMVTGLLLNFPETVSSQQKASVSIQLYTLDGGQLDFKNMGIFYDTGEHEGETGKMAVPCYLIHHGKEWMLWDTGNGDDIAEHQDGVMKLGIKFTMGRTLKGQLAQLGLKPDDIKYVVLSHLHPDHSGNIRLFRNAQFIVDSQELKWALGTPTPGGVEAALVSPLRAARVNAAEDDVDVFGDGTVRVLKGPGHTPGHRFLLVKLPQSGNLLITGDLYHTKENYEKHQVDVGNFNRAEELASFDRFDRLRTNLKARVIIQHSVEDFAAMPAFPNFLN